MQAQKFTIPETVASIDVETFSVDEIPPNVLDATVAYLLSQGAKWGDVASFASAEGYRNEGVFMFKGRTLEDLHTDYIDYGTVPPSYPPIENGLPTTYWSGVIAHNNVIWVDPKTIRDNLTEPFKYAVVPGTNNNAVYGVFRVIDVDYTVVCDPFECDYDEEIPLTARTAKPFVDAVNALIRSDEMIPFDCLSENYNIPNVLELRRLEV
jgi:hypothetical protein